MNLNPKSLKSFLANNRPNFGYDDANSLMEMLHYYYTICNPVDNAAIRCQFNHLHEILYRFTPEDAETIFSVTADLCGSYERQAFIDGIHVGIRLFAELSEID